MSRFKLDALRPLMALLICGLIDFFAFDSLSDYGTLPDWAESQTIWLLITVPLFLATLFFWARGQRQGMRAAMALYASYVTLSALLSVYALVASLAERREGDAAEGAAGLLWDAGILWGTNILIFAVWYWFVDGGGPLARDDGSSSRPDFAFTQQLSEVPGWKGWRPDFVDYLYLAFTTSTAFSPTDALPLSRRAKLLMLVESSVALVIVVTLVSRAVNIIT